MTKKAILKLDKDSLNEVARIYNGKEVIIIEDGENYSVVRPASADYPIFKVWNGWLKEIKQPMTVDEYLKPYIDEKKRQDSSPYCQRCWVQGNREGFINGEKNDRKRTQALINAVERWAEFGQAGGCHMKYETQILNALKQLKELDNANNK